jgi:hypothetical protein
MQGEALADYTDLERARNVIPISLSLGKLLFIILSIPN